MRRLSDRCRLVLIPEKLLLLFVASLDLIYGIWSKEVLMMCLFGEWLNGSFLKSSFLPDLWRTLHRIFPELSGCLEGWWEVH